MTIFSPRFAVAGKSQRQSQAESEKQAKIHPGRLIWHGLVRRLSLFQSQLCIIDSCCGIIRFKTLNVVASWAVFCTPIPIPIPIPTPAPDPHPRPVSQLIFHSRVLPYFLAAIVFGFYLLFSVWLIFGIFANKRDWL